VNNLTSLIYWNQTCEAETCTLGQNVKHTTSVMAISQTNVGIHYYKFIGSKLMSCVFGGHRIDDYEIEIDD